MTDTVESGARNAFEFDRILVGDAIEQLRLLPPGCVHCVVTSPPYWQQRDYGVAGQYGLEASREEYLAQQVAVFREVRRVLRDDGVMWLNMGDTYSSKGKHGGSSGARNAAQAETPRARRKEEVCAGNLNLIPYLLAERLQLDGWLLRQQIVWHKRSPMPKPERGWSWRGGELQTASWKHTLAHEPVFMLTKSMGYFCDAYAASEPVSETTRPRSSKATPKTVGRKRGLDGAANESMSTAIQGLVERRNPRSVLSLSTEPYKGKHSAPYPTALVKPLIEVATSAAGCCPECGTQWAPELETERVATRPGTATKLTGDAMTDGNRDKHRHITRQKLMGYRACCDCGLSGTVPAVVLDPYLGSGTTARVARALGRRWIGIELAEHFLADTRANILRPLPKARA